MIAVKSRFAMHTLFSCTNWSLVIAIAYAFVFFLQSSLRDNPEEPIIAMDSREEVCSVGPCLKGPLALRETSRSPLALSLEKQLVLIEQRMRPDWANGRRAFRIGVRGTSQERVIREEEPIFCDLSLHASGGAKDIVFVSGLGDVKMTPRFIDLRSIELLIEQEGQAAFEVILRSELPSQAKQLSDPVRKLFAAKWWGEDAFFSKYGGAIYREMGTKQKLVVDSQVLYVEDGSYLSLRDGQWRVLSSLSEAPSQSLLGSIRFNKKGNLDLELWDEKGFLMFQNELHKEIVAPIRTKPEQLITQPKRRTAQGVSCKINKRRWILKPGDWLLSTKNGIRRIDTNDEINRYLDQKLKGELIVIDHFDRGVLRGHVVDEMRTKTEPFFIQVVILGKGKGRL